MSTELSLLLQLLLLPLVQQLTVLLPQKRRLHSMLFSRAQVLLNFKL